MVTIQKLDDKYNVYQENQQIGTIALYDNPFHRSNCYVKLEMERLDGSMSAELFRKLRDIAGRPLQVMVGSDDTVLTEFLIAGGFTCKRKCYEVEAGKDDYVGGTASVPLLYCTAGELEYERCSRMMYAYYVASHEGVNPWTANFENFYKELPEMAAYAKIGDEIESLAFIEDNEIAYVCGKEKKHFTEFARCFTSAMLAKHETVFFESDDCDWAAMVLKSMFINQSETSYDTYIMENRKCYQP